MTMGVKVYYAEISGHKEVKKRQQRVMMILESKQIPYEAIDITEAGKEVDKEFMLKNAKPRGDSKYILSPQIFNEEVYCGDYDDFDLANENDVLENFLNTPKVERKFSMSTTQVSNSNNGNQNGGRESSAEAEALPSITTDPDLSGINGNVGEKDGEVVVSSNNEPQTTADNPTMTTTTSTTEASPLAGAVAAGGRTSAETEVSSTTTVGAPAPVHDDDDDDLGVGDETEDIEDEDEEGHSQKDH